MDAGAWGGEDGNVEAISQKRVLGIDRPLVAMDRARCGQPADARATAFVRKLREDESSGTYAMLRGKNLELMQGIDKERALRWFPSINPRLECMSGADLRVWAVPDGNWQDGEDEGGGGSRAPAGGPSEARRDARGGPSGAAGAAWLLKRGGGAAAARGIRRPPRIAAFDESRSVLLSAAYERIVTNGHGPYAAIAARDCAALCSRMHQCPGTDVVATTHGFLQFRDPLSRATVYYCGTMEECEAAISHARARPVADPARPTPLSLPPPPPGPMQVVASDPPGEESADETTDASGDATDSASEGSDGGGSAKSDGTDDDRATPPLFVASPRSHALPTIAQLFGIRAAPDGKLVPPDGADVSEATKRKIASLAVGSGARLLADGTIARGKQSTVDGMFFVRSVKRPAPEPAPAAGAPVPTDPAVAPAPECGTSANGPGEPAVAPLPQPPPRRRARVAERETAPAEPREAAEESDGRKQIAKVFCDTRCFYVACQYSRAIESRSTKK